MSKKVKRLFEGFRPTSYNLQLDPDSSTMKLTGSVEIAGQKTGRPSQRITFHQYGLKVTEASITKFDKKSERSVTVIRISHHKSFDEVRLHTEELLYPGTYKVVMRYKGLIQPGMHGIYASSYEVGGIKKKLISTQFESHHAREAFPSIDEPEAKATFELNLVSPLNETAISNMPAKSQVEKDGKLVTTFETTPKMSTYLLAFIYGDLHYKETQAKGGVQVRVWATKAQPLEALDFGLEVAKRGIEFFDEYYGVPYPLAKSDHVAIPDFSSAAMENWGLITYREFALLIDPATTSQSSREMVATVVTHELSHQWFGNLVTMRWWNDLWLNESFANVMEYVALDTLFPEWKVWNSFVVQEGLGAFRRDSIAGVQSISTEVRHPDEIITLFDPSIVYAKGGRLLNMLMQYLGEADFRKGLKEYFTRYAYENTSGSDLWAALSSASGKSVDTFMDPWLKCSGFPVVGVDQHGRELTLSQHHFLLDPAKADSERTWPVPLLSTSNDVPALLTEREQSLALQSDEFVRLNQGGVGHYIVHYKNSEHAAAIAQLVANQKLGIAERLMLLSDSSMLARAGSQSFDVTLKLLEHYVGEDSEPVWDIMSLIISDSLRFVDVDPKLEAHIKAFIRNLITIQFARLGWLDKPDESTQDTKLRATIIGLGVYAEHNAITSHALELFEAYKTDTKVIPPELRSIVFSAAIRNSAPGAFVYVLELEETTNNAELKHDLMSALASEKKTHEIDILLSRLKDTEKVRQQDVDGWLAGLLRNRYARRQAWDWLRNNWLWLEETFGEDKSYDYLPRYAASAFSTRQLLDEYKEFFEPLKEQRALARNITIGIEEINNRAAWLERDHKAVKAYFKSSL